MADKHGGTTEHRQQSAPEGRSREWGAIILGIACVGFGMYVLGAQHTGITADVKVLECHRVAGVRSSSTRCSGQWQDGTTISDVRIVGSSMPQPGDTVPMRIHGATAYSPAMGLPLISLGFGTVALLVGGYARHRRIQATECLRSDGQISPIVDH